MQSFLDGIADYMLTRFGGEMGNQCVVFPNRRAGLFFRQYLSKRIDKPFWLPQIFALEDFVVKKSGMRIADPLDLIVGLYLEYKNSSVVRAKTFADFLSWGNMILADFDEIDQNLADGQKVFTYLDELKALRSWNPDGGELTPMEREYLSFYNSLAPLYTEFRKTLLDKREGYFGLLFSNLMEKIDSVGFDEWDTILFAGFNALTSAEEKLIKILVAKGKAEVIWDADDYYINDDRQEAGKFLRKYLNDPIFRGKHLNSSTLLTDSKEIKVFGVPGNVAQARWAGQLASSMVKDQDPSDLAIILVDESLLLPVLNSMPPELEHFNITMGYPLKMTPAFSLIDALFRMILNAGARAEGAGREKAQSGSGLDFHCKDIDRLLNHEYLQGFRIDKTEHKEGQGKMRNAGIYQKPIELKSRLENTLIGADSLGVFFGPGMKYDPEWMIMAALALIELIHKGEARDGKEVFNVSALENEYLFYVMLLLKRLGKIVKESGLISATSTLYELFSTQAGLIRIPFYGEPLKGVQIMGTLETRTLDFRNLIILSVNEGMLPKGRHQSTFIPEEIRSEFGLLKYSDRNAVFAYHFYRLLQRGEKIHLLYTTEGDQLGGGEKSRFITQIQNELPLRNPGIQISEQILSPEPSEIAVEPFIVQKEGEIMIQLKEICSKGISPTSISTFLQCSLRFCYTYLMHLKELDQPEDTIDSACLGEAIHDALYKAYKNHQANSITISDLSSIQKSALETLPVSLKSCFPGADLSSGKNLLILKVGERMLKRYFAAEATFLKTQVPGLSGIEILKLEEWLEYTMDLGNGEGFVKLRGKADRIDRVNEIIRVVDYKTGQVQKSELTADSIGEIPQITNPSKLIQLLLYGLLYQRMDGRKGQMISPGIISLRYASRYFIGVNIGETDALNDKMLDEAELLFKDIIRLILNTSIPFSRTDNTEHCKNCPYSLLCNRLVV